MPESGTTCHRLRRAVSGPVVVTGAVAALSMAAALAPVVGAGWPLTWLLLGLTAGYALSGSA